MVLPLTQAVFVLLRCHSIVHHFLILKQYKRNEGQVFGSSEHFEIIAQKLIALVKFQGFNCEMKQKFRFCNVDPCERSNPKMFYGLFH